MNEEPSPRPAERDLLAPLQPIGDSRGSAAAIGSGIGWVHQRLGNAVLLTENGYGHVAFHDPSACIDRARIAYLVSLITPPKGTVCQSDKEPFTPGFG